MEKIDVSVVVPLYNEEDTFHMLVERLKNVQTEFSGMLEFVLINDGSYDQTAELMESLALTDPHFKCIFLSKNHGHQVAVSAGMKYCEATEAIMIIDGDLQDPPELLTEFYLKIQEGYDVVYGIRQKRKENIFKRMLYRLYYKTITNIAEIDLPLDSGDFSMVSRRVLDYMNQMPEKSRYLRGMRSWVGFKQYGYMYERHARAAGDSKYSLKMLFRLAYNGIFNFSEYPVKIITRLGMIISITSLVYLGYVIFRRIAYNDIPQGFTTLITAIVLFSGVQLLSLGIIGEYTLRIYNQVRQRPLFIVEKIIANQKVAEHE